MKINVHVINGSIFPARTHRSAAVNSCDEADSGVWMSVCVRRTEQRQRCPCRCLLLPQYRHRVVGGGTGQRRNSPALTRVLAPAWFRVFHVDSPIEKDTRCTVYLPSNISAQAANDYICFHKKWTRSLAFPFPFLWQSLRGHFIYCQIFILRVLVSFFETARCDNIATWNICSTRHDVIRGKLSSHTSSINIILRH